MSLFSVAIEPAPQPGLGKLQIVPHYVHGQSQRFGGVFGAHSPEVAHFDQTRQLLIFGSKSLQCEIQVQEFHQLDSGFAFHLEPTGSRDGGNQDPFSVDRGLACFHSNRVMQVA